MLTKLDGDARGGAALSIKALTGKPIKFAGIGEKLDQIEPFHPDRMAGASSAWGDVLTLIEKAEQNLDQKKAEEMASVCGKTASRSPITMTSSSSSRAWVPCRISPA